MIAASNSYLRAIFDSGVVYSVGKDGIVFDPKVISEHGIVDVRRDLTRRFAWAIPDKAAIRTAAKYNSIVEMGAGTGYWSELLTGAGADVVAYDIAPPGTDRYNEFHFGAKQHDPVIAGEPSVLRRHHPSWALLLCWPAQNGMVGECLQHYAGSTVIYVGEEGPHGCTGWDPRLQTDFACVKKLRIPRWRGLRDALYVYRRKTR